MKELVLLCFLCTLSPFCQAQSFEGEIRFVFTDTQNQSDTSLTTYGTGKIKSECSKSIWKYGFHCAYFDYKKYPLNCWHLYNKDENILLKQENPDYIADEIVKLDSLANILGIECQLYMVTKPSQTYMGAKVQEVNIVYSSPLEYELPEGWTMIPPIYAISNRISLMVERIVYKNGKVNGRTVTKAIQIISKEVDEGLLSPPESAFVRD